MKAAIADSISIFQALAASAEAVSAVSEIGCACGDSLARGGKILLAGNGGSAADSQHIAAEFVGRLQKESLPLPALALTTDTAILTAVGNDYGFDRIFERQVEAFGNPGDVSIAISTSGNSQNIVHALRAAKRKNLICVGLTGRGGGIMTPLCDYLVRVPSGCAKNVQEVHIAVGHIICEIAEAIWTRAANAE